MARMTKQQKALQERVNRCAQRAVYGIQIQILKIPALFKFAEIKAEFEADDAALIAEIRAEAQRVAA